MQIHPVKIGFDVELFITNATKPYIIPLGPNNLAGTKDKPIVHPHYRHVAKNHHFRKGTDPTYEANPILMQLYDEYSCYTQRDGVAAEIGADPTRDKNDFVSRVMMAKDTLQQELDNSFGLKNVYPVSYPCYEFTKDELYDIADAHVVGCDPDFNAYTETQNPQLNILDFGGLRTIGGHLHIDFPGNLEVNFTNQCRVVRILDYMLTIPLYQQYAHSMYNHKSKIRRQFYGKAGDFRPKPYGVEYRVLDSAWVNDPYVVMFVFSACQKIMTSIDELEEIMKLSNTSLLVREAINSNNFTVFGGHF